jgi:hypothetical protein
MSKSNKSVPVSAKMVEDLKAKLAEAEAKLASKAEKGPAPFSCTAHLPSGGVVVKGGPLSSWKGVYFKNAEQLRFIVANETEIAKALAASKAASEAADRAEIERLKAENASLGARS